MTQQCMSCHGKCLLCRPVSLISKFIGVEGGWKTRLDTIRDHKKTSKGVVFLMHRDNDEVKGGVGLGGMINFIPFLLHFHYEVVP